MVSKSNRTRNPPRRIRGARGVKTPVTNITFSEILLPEIIGGNSGSNVAHVNIMPTVMPWLRTTAATFSKYTLKKVVITFLPGGSMTYVGQVVGAFTYDSFENPPSTFAQVSQTARHRIRSVHQQQSWVLDVKNLSKQLFPVISAERLLQLDEGDRLPYLPAIFHFSTNSTNTQTLGSVQISYSVDFSAPLFLEAGSFSEPVVSWSLSENQEVLENTIQED